MYPAVKNVVPAENYLLIIEFDNGESGILDMKPFLNFGLFQKLKDQSAFNQVRVAFDTIEWASGVDLDPEFIYAKSRRTSAWKAVAAEEKMPFGWKRASWKAIWKRQQLVIGQQMPNIPSRR